MLLWDCRFLNDSPIRRISGSIETQHIVVGFLVTYNYFEYFTKNSDSIDKGKHKRWQKKRLFQTAR